MCCGRTDGQEGYGTPVWCLRCDIGVNTNEAENIRAGIKRNQTKLHQRMLQSSLKKFQLVLEKCHNSYWPDRMTSLRTAELDWGSD